MDRVGKPPYKPKPADRRNVELMKADNWSDDRIAHRLGISRPTLLKYFDNELQYGIDSERLKTLQYLEAAAKKGNASAIKMKLTMLGVAAGQEAIDAGAGDQQRAARVQPIGKKEVELQAALDAGKNSEWGEDLAPLPRAIN